MLAPLVFTHNKKKKILVWSKVALSSTRAIHKPIVIFLKMEMLIKNKENNFIKIISNRNIIEVFLFSLKDRRFKCSMKLQ